MSALKKNKKFELPDSLYIPDNLYSVSDIQYYFKFIMRSHETVADYYTIRTHVNEIERKITVNIEKVYYLELLISEMLRLRDSTWNKIAKDENGWNVPGLEITEVLPQCNLVKQDYQHDSSVLYTLLANKLLGQLLDIVCKICIFLKTINSEFSYI